MGLVSTWMGDRGCGKVYLSYPAQLSLAIPPCVDTMSTRQTAVMLCGWGVKARMVREWVAGKTDPLAITGHI